jgi:transcriptional regulator with XRE-family HTH domain
MHIAQKFEALLKMYGHPDGRKWSGQEIDEATDGVVSRSYVTNLRKGRIENPGYEKMRAIAKAMGFAPEVWFEDGLSKERSIGQAEVSYGVSAWLEHVFEIIRNPKTGDPYTVAGNRHLNNALHMVATCQARSDARGGAYYRKKIAEGKSRKEALRCLKRRISDAVFKSLMADSRTPSRSAA